MSKFKVGDRVRCVIPVGGSPKDMWVGVTGTVRGYENGYVRVQCDEDARYSNGDPIIPSYTLPTGAGILESSLELIPPVEPTDAELAAEYRTLITRMREIRNQMEGRGFELKLKPLVGSGYTTVAKSTYDFDRLVFFKTVTTNTEV